MTLSYASRLIFIRMKRFTQMIHRGLQTGAMSIRGVRVICNTWICGIRQGTYSVYERRNCEMKMYDYNWWDDRTVEAPDLCPYTMQGCYSGECEKCEVEREFVEEYTRRKKNDT